MENTELVNATEVVEMAAENSKRRFELSDGQKTAAVIGGSIVAWELVKGIANAGWTAFTTKTKLGQNLVAKAEAAKANIEAKKAAKKNNVEDKKN